MKKILTFLGTLSIVSTAPASVISCNSNNNSSVIKSETNANGSEIDINFSNSNFILDSISEIKIDNILLNSNYYLATKSPQIVIIGITNEKYYIKENQKIEFNYNGSINYVTNNVEKPSSIVTGSAVTNDTGSEIIFALTTENYILSNTSYYINSKEVSSLSYYYVVDNSNKSNIKITLIFNSKNNYITHTDSVSIFFNGIKPYISVTNNVTN